MDLNDPRLTDLAFRILPIAREFARELGKDGQLETDVISTVAARISAIEDGLSPELEFIAAVNWLGRALAVNRIDQLPLPTYCKDGPEMAVPDILCVASVKGKPLPVLIEVKKSIRNPIVWNKRYLGGLRAYADALGLPLLLAWKHHHVWTLTDIRHFEKKVDAYHLGHETALRENLMTQMFGDLLIVLTQRVALFIDAEVSGDAPLPPLPSLLPVGTHTFTIRGAGFLVDGKRVDMSPELKGLFFRAPTESLVDRTGERTVRMLYTPEPETMFSLMDFALMLMLWNQDGNPDWEKVARDEISTTAEDARKQLRGGIEIGVVQYILEQQPNTKADFIKE